MIYSETQIRLKSFALCACALFIAASACDDEPSYPGPSASTTPEAKPGEKPEEKPGKKPARKGPKADKKPFDMEWTGETARSEGDHITGRMKLANRTIVATTEGIDEEKNAEEMRVGFCEALKDSKRKIKCAAPDADTKGLDTVTLTAKLLSNTSSLSKGKNKDKTSKPKAKIKSAANTSVGGRLTLNEGAEHFMFRTKFRATSALPKGNKSWWTHLGTALGKQWSTRLDKRMRKGEENLKPSEAFVGIHSVPEFWDKEAKPFRYHFNTMLKEGALICYGAKGEPEQGRVCHAIGADGKIGESVRFGMGEAGENEKRALKSWSRPNKDHTKILVAGDGFKPEKGEVPKPPLEETKQNVWIAQVDHTGSLSLVTIVPDFFPHSPVLDDKDGNLFFVAWGIKEMELIKWNPKDNQILGRWKVSDIADEYDLLWLDDNNIAIVPEGLAAIHAQDISSERARSRKIWTWPSGKSPVFDDNKRHIYPDNQGGLLILDGDLGTSRTAYHVSGTGKTLWNIRLGKSPEFDNLIPLNDKLAALLGKELRFIDLKAGNFIGRDSRQVHALTAIKNGPHKGVIIGCGKPGIIAYKDMKPWRGVRLKKSCKQIAQYDTQFLALQPLTIIGLKPLEEWEKL